MAYHLPSHAPVRRGGYAAGPEGVVPFLVDVQLLGDQTARSPPRTDEVLEDIVALQRQAICVITDNDLRLDSGFLERRVAEFGQGSKHLRYSVYVFIDRLGGLPIPA